MPEGDFVTIVSTPDLLSVWDSFRFDSRTGAFEIGTALVPEGWIGEHKCYPSLGLVVALRSFGSPKGSHSQRPYMQPGESHLVNTYGRRYVYTRPSIQNPL